MNLVLSELEFEQQTNMPQEKETASQLAFQYIIFKGSYKILKYSKNLYQKLLEKYITKTRYT